MSDADSMRHLVGRTINGIYVSAPGNLPVLLFETDQGDVMYTTEGDCCSRSWFHEVLGVQALLGHTVRAAEFEGMGTLKDPEYTEEEVVQIYGHKLTTEAGRADVIFRNASNGFYGGWSGLYKGDRPVDLIQITEDWEADQAIGRE